MSRQRVWLAVVAALAVSTCWPSPARAQSTYVLEVFFNNVLVSGSATPVAVQQGSAATFAVVLREQPGAGGSELAANGGLFGGGVRATFDNSGAGPLRLTAEAAIQPNQGFTAVARDIQPTFAQFEANVGFTGGTPLPPDGQNRVPLGSFTFDTPNVGAVTVQFADPPGDGTFVFGNGQRFDGRVTGSSVPVEVVPVPEPAGLLAAAGGLLAAAARARRVRRPTA